MGTLLHEAHNMATDGNSHASAASGRRQHEKTGGGVMPLVGGGEVWTRVGEVVAVASAEQPQSSGPDAPREERH